MADVADTDRVRAALSWFEDFAEDSDRVPFLDPDSAGGKAYNQETLDLFIEYMRDRGSRKKGAEGQPLRAQHIGSMASTIRILVEREHRGLITCKEDNVVGPQLLRQMRKEDGPSGQRRLSRAIRALHLRAAADKGFDRTSRRGAMKWAVAVTSLNILLRGGEPGVTKRSTPVDPKRDITFSSFEWREPCEESRGRPWLLLDIVGIKDTQYKNRVTPMPICRRHTWEECSFGEDPLCPYDALLRVWRASEGAVPAAERVYHGGSSTPFFIGEAGGVWCTKDSQALAREIAAWLGFPPDEFGGKAFRIGGATDLREIHGAGAQLLIKERGRWGSDVAQLYQRGLLRVQLDVSAGMGDAHTRDMEEMVKDWVQPAHYFAVGG